MAAWNAVFRLTGNSTAATTRSGGVGHGDAGFLEGQLGRAPTVDELADYAAVPKTDVLESRWAAGGRSGVPLETALPSNDDRTLQSAVGDGDTDMVAAEDSMFIAHLVRRLPEDQRQVVLLSYFSDLSQYEIAARLGISQMTVSRLRRRALDLLRTTARTEPAAG